MDQPSTDSKRGTSSRGSSTRCCCQHKRKFGFVEQGVVAGASLCAGTRVRPTAGRDRVPRDPLTDDSWQRSLVMTSILRPTMQRLRSTDREDAIPPARWVERPTTERNPSAGRCFAQSWQQRNDCARIPLLAVRCSPGNLPVCFLRTSQFAGHRSAD
jgi:hypothetical protein